jgi:L-2-hydroxyglutarate oxidase LhgO
MERDCDVVVIGGGVVGLAAAAALARARRTVVLVERHAALAQEITSRNSEVIHAGIYYPEGSLKARTCVAGREALYARCAKHGIPHRRIGKWIVATSDAEIATLEAIERKGNANGVPGLRMLERGEIVSGEPDVRAVAALESPETGIVDGHALCLSLAAEAEEHGALLVMNTEVCGIEGGGGGYRVETRSRDSESAALHTLAVVNAAGLAGDRIAGLAGIDIDARGYRLHPCKGDYFSLTPSAPLVLSRLVYPVPSGAGLGVHATLDLAGRIRFGPDAHYVEKLDYAVDPAKGRAFAAAAGRYLTVLRPEWLSPDYAGIRPKLAAEGEAFRDFEVNEESDIGLPGFVNLVGIESPGLTASLAIGERVVELLASF